MNLMARREHARAELKGKLNQRFPDMEREVTLVLDQLESEGLLNDSRFAGLFLASASRKGKGPLYIRQHLRQKGVSEQLVEEAFRESEVDWFSLAKQVLEKRFGGPGGVAYSEKAKRMRFLQYRGFTGDQIAYCFER